MYVFNPVIICALKTAILCLHTPYYHVQLQTLRNKSIFLAMSSNTPLSSHTPRLIQSLLNTAHPPTHQVLSKNPWCLLISKTQGLVRQALAYLSFCTDPAKYLVPRAEAQSAPWGFEDPAPDSQEMLPTKVNRADLKPVTSGVTVPPKTPSSSLQNQFLSLESINVILTKL